MTVCAVKWCHNTSERRHERADITFHRFPSNPITAGHWTKHVRLSRNEKCWKPTRNTRMCSEHFSDKDKYKTRSGLCKLRVDAEPKKHTAKQSTKASDDEDTPLSSYTTNQNSEQTDIEMPKPLKDPRIKKELKEEIVIDDTDDIEIVEHDIEMVEHDTEIVEHDTKIVKHDTEIIQDDTEILEHDIEIVEHDIKQEVKKSTMTPEVSIPTADNRFDYFIKMDTAPNYITPDISKAVILKSILTRKAPIKKDMANDSLSFNYGQVIDKTNFNPPKETLGPKIVTTTTLADTGVCLFCNNNERRIGTQRELTTISNQKTYEKVLSYAEKLYDYDLLEKLNQSDSFPYHALCRTEYRNKYEKLNRKNCDDEDWLVFKNLHAEAFEGLCAFIDDNIIDKHKTYYLSDLYERYKALLQEIQNSASPFEFTSYSPQNLQEKIITRYFGLVDVTTAKDLKRKVVHKSEITSNFNSAVAENEDLKFDKLAFELRNVIKSMGGTTSGGKTDDIPEQLLRFVGSLIQGPDIRRTNPNDDSVRIKSMCENIVSQVMKD